MVWVCGGGICGSGICGVELAGRVYARQPFLETFFASVRFVLNCLTLFMALY